MLSLPRVTIVLALLLGVGSATYAENQVIVERNLDTAATAEYRFKSVPSPSKSDAGNLATLSLISGQRDGNGAGLDCLTDGRVPRNEDQPSENFFFTGTSGGRILLDLGKSIDIQQVNTYSWHPDVRGPQVYTLYGAADGTENLDLAPRRRRDLERAGWTRLAEVDTRHAGQAIGGQYGVSVRGAGTTGLGQFRYLLLDVDATEPNRRQSHTFLSEVDILDGNNHPMPERVENVDTLKIGDNYEIVFDATEVPQIRPWINQTLKPIGAEWYPKIVEMLPSEHFSAPTRFSIVFHKDMDGVAHASGTTIHCAGPWFMRNLEGEAAGAVVHEMVHVVQQYRGGRGGNRNPGWMVEGVADYIRWFLYEPEDQRPRVNPERANYDDSYRTSAAFLDYVVREHDPKLIEKFNAAMRSGEYDEKLWVEYTQKTPAELWAEFVKTL